MVCGPRVRSSRPNLHQPDAASQARRERHPAFYQLVSRFQAEVGAAEGEGLPRIVVVEDL